MRTPNPNREQMYRFDILIFVINDVVMAAILVLRMKFASFSYFFATSPKPLTFDVGKAIAIRF